VINLFWAERIARRVAADTIAMFFFGVSTSVLAPFVVLYEFVVAGLTIEQWTIIFGIYKVLRYIGASFCAELRNSLGECFLGALRNRFRRAMADAAALSIYQLPLYTVSALIAGVSIYQIVIILAVHLARNALLGWWYGVILDWTHARFSTSSGKISSAV